MKQKRIILSDDIERIVDLSQTLEIDNNEIIPKIKIYDPKDGGYFYRKIGFRSNISSEER